MKLRIIWCLACLSLSCNERMEKPTIQNPDEATQNNFKKSFVGKWGSAEGKAVFQFSKDSMYYVGENKSYYYLVHEKDIIVLYKEGPYILRDVRSNGDTLFFKMDGSGEGETQSYKVK